jgi:Tfp pilus assembly protein PilF
MATAKTPAPAIATCAAHFNAGELDAAQHCLERVLAARPSAEAHTYLGIIADGRNDLSAAEKHFARAARLAPRKTAMRNNYGALLMRLGRNADAAREFSASLALDPRQIDTLINLAQLEYQAGDQPRIQAALSHLMQAYKLEPGSAKILRALVAVNLALNQKVTAARFYSEFAKEVVEQEQPWLTPELRAELGHSLMQAGLHAIAEQEFSAACVEPCRQPEFVALRARAQLQQQKIREAGKTLEAAVSAGVESSGIYALLAEIYESVGRPDQAIPAMRLAIQHDPQNEGLHFRYGMLLVDSKAPQAAVLRLEEAVKLLPQSKKLWFALGFAQFEATKIDQARVSLSRALELDARFVPALAYMGVVAFKQTGYAEAIEYYEQALSVDPNQAMVRYLLAETIQKNQNPDLARAERELQHALTQDPKLAAARLSLGKLLANSSRDQEAVVQLETAVKVDPTLAEAHYRLGRLYQRLKRTEEAKASMNRYKQLGEAERERNKAEFRTLAQKLANTLF